MLVGGLAREMATSLEDAGLRIHEGLGEAMEIAIRQKDVSLQTHLLKVMQDSTLIVRIAALWQRGDLDAIQAILAPALPAQIEEVDDDSSDAAV